MVTMNIGKGATLDVELSELPGLVHDWSVFNWVRLTLERANASITEESEPDPVKRAELAKAASAKRWESLKAGTIRATVTRETDPVKAEVKRLATVKANAALKAAKLDPKTVAQAAWEGLMAKYSADPKIIAQAEATVAMLKEPAEELDADVAAILGIEVAEPTPAPRKRKAA